MKLSQRGGRLLLVLHSLVSFRHKNWLHLGNELIILLMKMVSLTHRCQNQQHSAENAGRLEKAFCQLMLLLEQQVNICRTSVGDVSSGCASF